MIIAVCDCGDCRHESVCGDRGQHGAGLGRGDLHLPAATEAHLHQPLLPPRRV